MTFKHVDAGRMNIISVGETLALYLRPALNFLFILEVSIVERVELLAVVTRADLKLL
jgi:hypothetical protein